MPAADADLASYPLLDALRNRCSRRFGTGMEMPKGPLAYRSDEPGLRLSEDEEALLAFAACGLTGDALVDLGLRPGGGGTIIAGTSGRTVASGDAIHTVAVFVTNEDGTCFLKRPQDFPPGEIPELVELAREGHFTKLYRRSRVKIKDERAAPPLHPMYNLAVNQWSLYDPASSYFLPVHELTLLYVNGILEILDQPTGAFLVDERTGFRPAGLGRFARSRGGHLHGDPPGRAGAHHSTGRGTGHGVRDCRAGHGVAEPGADDPGDGARRIPALGRPPLRLARSPGFPHAADARQPLPGDEPAAALLRPAARLRHYRRSRARPGARR